MVFASFLNGISNGNDFRSSAILFSSILNNKYSNYRLQSKNFEDFVYFCAKAVFLMMNYEIDVQHGFDDLKWQIENISKDVHAIYHF